MIPPHGPASPNAPEPATSPELERADPHPKRTSAPEHAPRIALAHDWLVGYRGGEAVLEAIARIVLARYQPAGLWTMFHDPAAMASAVHGQDGPVATFALHPVWTSSLNRLPRRARRWLLPLYPMAVGELSRALAHEHARRPIDLLISTSSAAIKGLRPPAGVPHLCYCHTPARYLWSQADQYATGRAGRLRALGLRALGPALRRWDKRTAAHVTTFIANSTHTAAEIRRCFGRDAEVIHPPVRTDYFTPDLAPWREKFWLYVGALEPYKRVDLAIEAAREWGARLVIVGDGSQAAHLRAIAPPNVEFRGRLPDDELRDLYRTASVLVFPQTEDFGIVAVEAQACGLPVAAYRAGGALDTVVHRVTGALCREASPKALGRAASACAHEASKMSFACRQNAERFSEAAFTQKMTAAIERALS